MNNVRHITTVPNDYNEAGMFNSPNILQVHSRYVRHSVRLAIGYVGPDGAGRQVSQGPMVPGPWAYTFALAVCIDNHGGTGAESDRNKAADLEWDVQVGDLFVIDGRTYELRDDQPMNYPQLVLLGN